MRDYLPMELYHAARETCIKLYVANGGRSDAVWTVKPYPGTAAISCYQPFNDAPHWTLAMPAFPLDVRLARWKCDLVGAYTVHELCHALWTDWESVKRARVEGLHNLQNAIEDCRIEAKAGRGDMLMVSEARRLLQALNAHIARRALSNPAFALDQAANFSFILGLVIFAEKLGYVSDLPADWRPRVKPEWLPLIDLALARFDALKSTDDVLVLCRDLKALAATAPAAPRPPVNPARRPVKDGDGEGEPSLALPPRDREIVEAEAAEAETAGAEAAETGNIPSEAPEKSEGELSEAPDAPRPEAGLDQPLPSPELPPEAEEAEAEDIEDDEEIAGDDCGERGGTGNTFKAPKDESALPPVEDLSDATQVYEEAHLDDVAAETAKEAGKTPREVYTDAMHAATVVNVATPTDKTEQVCPRWRTVTPKTAGAAIETPAKLRRHLTLAVKSPERVAFDRHQVSGRLDLRDSVGLATGAPNVFKRRIEEEGREAVVSFLIDISGSMKGERLKAAKALALHMGDALKAAGVRFEIVAFDDTCVITPKPMNKGWADETKRAVASMQAMNGTAMLPALKLCAERLLKAGNATRRILLALTDGQDGYAQEANTALCRYYRARGVEIIGIGLQAGRVGGNFDDKAVSVRDCSALSRTGLSELVKVLNAGAPRQR